MTPFTTPSGTSDHSKSPTASNLTLPEPRWRVRIFAARWVTFTPHIPNYAFAIATDAVIHDHPRRFVPPSTQPHVLPPATKSTRGSSSVDPIPQSWVGYGRAMEQHTRGIESGEGEVVQSEGGLGRKGQASQFVTGCFTHSHPALTWRVPEWRCKAKWAGHPSQPA
jgi:hypothetical protein